jgi:hypothetical protein
MLNLPASSRVNSQSPQHPRRRLTLPSRGRPQAGYAHLRPPLMSNVRPLQMPSGSSHRYGNLPRGQRIARRSRPSGRYARTSSGSALQHRKRVLGTLQQHHGSPRHRQGALGAFRGSQYLPELAIAACTKSTFSAARGRCARPGTKRISARASSNSATVFGGIDMQQLVVQLARRKPWHIGRTQQECA